MQQPRLCLHYDNRERAALFLASEPGQVARLTSGRLVGYAVDNMLCIPTFRPEWHVPLLRGGAAGLAAT